MALGHTQLLVMVELVQVSTLSNFSCHGWRQIGIMRLHMLPLWTTLDNLLFFIASSWKRLYAPERMIVLSIGCLVGIARVMLFEVIVQLARALRVEIVGKFLMCLFSCYPQSCVL